MLKQLILDHTAAVAQLAVAKERELTLRTTLFNLLVQEGLAKPIGAKTSKVDGFKIEAAGKQNVSIFEPGIETVRSQLTVEQFMAVFPAKLSYSATGHKALPTSELKEIVNEGLLITPGTPTVKVSLLNDDA